MPFYKTNYLLLPSVSYFILFSYLFIILFLFISFFCFLFFFVEKWLLEIFSHRANLSSCKFEPWCKIVFVQNWPLMRNCLCAILSFRANLSSWNLVPSCNFVCEQKNLDCFDWNWIEKKIWVLNFVTSCNFVVMQFWPVPKVNIV